MQDIPRNELLDKLAAGWKVRRKVWRKDLILHQSRNTGWMLSDSLLNDWEGEPPQPVKNYEGLDIATAFRHLRGGSAFIRRASWPSGRQTHLMTIQFHVCIDDILATDWEVWG